MNFMKKCIEVRDCIFDIIPDICLWDYLNTEMSLLRFTRSFFIKKQSMVM